MKYRRVERDYSKCFSERNKQLYKSADLRNGLSFFHSRYHRLFDSAYFFEPLLTYSLQFNGNENFPFRAEQQADFLLLNLYYTYFPEEAHF